MLNDCQRYFEWDDRKAEANFNKHGIRFEEAALVFNDPFALSEQDRIENGEQRWQTIGMSGSCLMLLVAHTVCYEEQSIEIVRIISARRVNKKERRRYEQGEV
ncbi:BrnT family toxin [Acidithiobacillus thiooxidans]|uniref:BrnT family toxin n=1 Tax=Acidithiobacillus thiooxidans ATCC 19377 TaxID=637390 RepID=A0A543Q3F4_ACITH|nr:BrnT family toxin [Acidithiobacillus thiooxidans]MBU2811793.1 BrnT family toxin [Acidithiobacillus thiooxidans]MBU2838630.1 BrnT family toxin [Acidithiobacillus thiooxidans]MDX5935046.1 BrnT family toxin [Acidithiobacillus thiooxidans]TQN50828.1 hypothetical protein DLNHIDIE_00684 [Acidithiobacillus thiooxidans ATCC 19377]